MEGWLEEPRGKRRRTEVCVGGHRNGPSNSSFLRSEAGQMHVRAAESLGYARAIGSTKGCEAAVRTGRVDMGAVGRLERSVERLAAAQLTDQTIRADRRLVALHSYGVGPVALRGLRVLLDPDCMS